MNKNDKKYFKEMIEDNDLFHVSIPMTVLGGLQYIGYRRKPTNIIVSIPMTVLGGLQ